jgi:hypothetical protein
VPNLQFAPSFWGAKWRWRWRLASFLETLPRQRHRASHRIASSAASTATSTIRIRSNEEIQKRKDEDADVRCVFETLKPLNPEP